MYLFDCFLYYLANLATRLYVYAIPFQALTELMNKREKDLSRKDNIFEIAEEDELLNDINDSKNKVSLPDEDLL